MKDFVFYWRIFVRFIKITKPLWNENKTYETSHSQNIELKIRLLWNVCCLKNIVCCIPLVKHDKILFVVYPWLNNIVCCIPLVKHDEYCLLYTPG